MTLLRIGLFLHIWLEIRFIGFGCRLIICQAYGGEVRLIGSSGAGQTAKMMNQICIAAIVQGLSEALAFGQKAGLNMEEVLAVISKGAAQSWQMENRSATMLQDKFDFGFALDWMIKDLGIAIEEAGRHGAKLPGTETILSYYKKLSAQGYGRLNTSALIKRLHGRLNTSALIKRLR